MVAGHANFRGIALCNLTVYLHHGLWRPATESAIIHVPHVVESKPGCVPVIKILPKRTLNVGHSLEWFVRQNKEVGLEFMSVSIFFFLNPEIFLFEICVSKKVKKTGK